MSRPFLSRCTCVLRPPPNSRANSSAPRRAPPPAIASASSTARAAPLRAPPRYAPEDAALPTPDNRRYGPRARTSTAPEAADSWRSRAHSTPKRSYLESGDQPMIQPRIGQALRDYQRLPAEARRREDVARERLMREISPNKLYAQEREKERILNSKLDKRDPTDVRKLILSAKAVMPGRREASMAQEEARHATGRGVGKLLKSATYHAKITPTRLVPGTVNRGTRAAVTDRKTIQPVVRGGAAKNPNRPRSRPKVLRKVVLPSTVRLENLTNLLGVRLWTLQKAMERIGLENTRPERLLTAEDASLIALELDFDPVIDDDAAFDIYPSPPPANADLLPLRPPVTGIFGHVDHGKTSLLDSLRSTSVASGEAGGITQHIGAFEVSVATMIANLRAKDKKAPAASPSQAEESPGTITFLDTPGHAAFTAMRERGAGVTDVVVLVVAADDGVKPQTEEVIGLIKSANVGVVVAITKVDKPGVDTVKVKQSLMAAGIEIEAFGGDVPCVEVSSMTGQGLPELLETISAIAEVRELKAERDGRVEGRVLESRLEKGRGNVATVLVLRGCLKRAASLVAGTTWCRVRSLVPPTGKDVTSAFPGQPVEVTGWKDLPSAGDLVLEAASEDEAKKAVSNRLRRIEQDKLWQDVEVINEKRRVDSEIEEVRKKEEAKAKASGLTGNAITMAGNVAVGGLDSAIVADVKELVLVIKADVSGTVEAVVGALQGIGNKEARVKISSASVGDVQESDVELARAIGGCVVGFNVKAPNAVLKLASRPPTPVAVHTSPIIYRLVELVREAVADLLPRTIETRVHGEAIIQQVFEIAVKGRKEPKKVAGCKVSNGVFQKARRARVVRNGEVFHTGTVSTLKQVKKDVLEITKGVECGIALDDFDAFEPLDVIQSVEAIEHKAVL